MADLQKVYTPWDTSIIEDVDAMPLDQQINMITGSIQEMAQKRYSAWVNAKVFKSPDHEKTANEATEAITKLRLMLADIRRRQAGRIRAEAQRIQDEASAARQSLADSLEEIREAEGELSAARDAEL